MLALPPVLPDTAWRFGTRIGREHHVRIETCDYSVPPKSIGRLVEVRLDLDEVTVTLAGEVIARHRRSLAKHRTITDEVHAIERDALRVVASAIADARSDHAVEVRDLTSYDRALGIV